MSFRRAARAALGSPSDLPRVPATLAAIVVIAVAGVCFSCSKNNDTGLQPGPNHSAYVTLPQKGSVLLLEINATTGAITLGPETPEVTGTSPTGLAITPNRKFVYAVNSRANTISIFSVAPNGTLTLTSTPTAAGNGADAAVVDPSGSYLLVTNSADSTVSVFSIDSSSGALAQTGPAVDANLNPTEIVITHSGNFVYVTNPGIGMVTGFSFSSGTLTPLTTTPVFSGAGASGLAVDGSDRFLYVTNPTATYPEQSSVGSVSGFTIDSGSGALTTMIGSPFTYINTLSGPTAITVDPSGTYVYATAPGSGFAIWCFTITPLTGQLTAVTNSPFSLAAGGLFTLIDPRGNFLYIGTQSGSGIEAYTYNTSTGAPTQISGSPFSTGTPPGKMVLSE
jgi:6-phosphogluconolactonase